jgi:MFS family permease
MIACFGAQTVVRGAMNVLLVVAAIQLLGLGDSGVGTLNFAVGLGGFIGALAALTLIGRPRLSGALALALVFWGLPLAAIGLVPTTPAAIVVLIVLGASNAILDVAGFTLIQRTLPNAERVAVLAVIEVAAGAGVAIGSAAAPVLLTWLGLRGALLVTGAILPIAALATWPRLRHIDDDWVVPAHELRLLCRLPMFAPLPLTVIERLASELTRVEFAPGATLMRQGEPGDLFYVIEDGEVAIEKDGRRVPLLGPLSAVGEIALLRNVPRTATVRTVTRTVAYALSAPEFVSAVTGNRASAAAAAGRVDGRLAAIATEHRAEA